MHHLFRGAWFLAVLLLGITAVLRRLGTPNQLLVAGGAILLVELVVLPLALRLDLREAPGRRSKILAGLAIVPGLLALPLILGGRTMDLRAATALGLLCAALYLVWVTARARLVAASQHRWSTVGVAVLVVVPVLLALGASPLALQLPDRRFHPSLPHPEHLPGTGPMVLIDEGHHNFHRMDGGYWGFAELLRTDGYRVQPHRGTLLRDSLAGARLLVIAGALHESNVERWELPTPSAFTPDEIATTERWVTEGGALLLVVEHLPFAGASGELARAFGFEIPNGFTVKAAAEGGFSARYVDLFVREDGTLLDSVVANGRRPDERVGQVAAFTGIAFEPPAGAIPLLVLGPGHELVLAAAAWELGGAPRSKADGMCQAAIVQHGQGRVAVVGEAAMLTTQLVAGLTAMPYGMNAPEASDNWHFVLNLVHWLVEPGAASQMARRVDPRHAGAAACAGVTERG